MKKYIIVLLSIILLSQHSVFAKTAQKHKSMLEIREVQTHVFDTPDVEKVTKAVISTLQDNGFIVQIVEPDLGHIRAKKETKLKRTDKGRVAIYSTCILLDSFSSVFGNVYGMYDLYVNSMRLDNELSLHPVIFDSNVNIEKVGKTVKVRFIVIEKVLENADGYTTVKSSPRKVVRHYDPELYQEFFSQVSKSLFLEDNKI